MQEGEGYISLPPNPNWVNDRHKLYVIQMAKKEISVHQPSEIAICFRMNAEHLEMCFS